MSETHADAAGTSGGAPEEFAPLEVIPGPELARRHEQARAILARHAPDAAGLMAFSKVNIYYLSGTLVSGVFWLPREGEPVLLVRRGLERARLESSLENLGAFRSFGDVPGLLADFGNPLGGQAACEMDGLPWSLGARLARYFKGVELVPGDAVLLGSRAVKTEWELDKMRRAGELHRISLEHILPERIRPGMSEREISIKAWEVFFERGHSGPLRMGNFGEELFLGHVAAGDSGNYPSAFNGPLGIRGGSPAMPFMGSADVVWDGKSPLSCDIGFVFEGYHSDKTSIYWGPDAAIPDQVKRAHAFCVEVQNWIAGRAVPGATPAEIYAHCARWGEKSGYAEGFMALGGNKVPFVGHGIGLVIDEYPPLADRFDEPLQAGMCLALEPKIGIPGLGMVGVENTFEVREGGAECLSGRHFDIIRVSG